jgi:hypothetical protein
MEQRANHLKDKSKKMDDENKDLRVANIKGKMQTMDLEEMNKLNQEIENLKMDEHNFKYLKRMVKSYDKERVDMQRLIKQHQLQTDRITAINKEITKVNSEHKRMMDDKDLELKRMTNELQIAKEKNK